MGKKLSDGLSKHNDIEIAYPTEANEVFAKFPREKIEHLNSEGYKMNEEELDGKAVRLVAAWNTKDSDVDELLNTIKALIVFNNSSTSLSLVFQAATNLTALPSNSSSFIL